MVDMEVNGTYASKGKIWHPDDNLFLAYYLVSILISSSVRLEICYLALLSSFESFQAFVDSGAQSTIISKSCAERCGLLRLMDQRYEGILLMVLVNQR
ncbi:hypothetical protein BRARA_E02789 [Brassica rapa]|uniref:Aspartic peptidase DDI1-type domain-containing protein n=1 Tax=Brassica campestris TaxID=3711 RepID=A0A397ZFU8_BRACM|nr:hypothetical protein BRARA_E02789 [Brassica rapa]